MHEMAITRSVIDAVCEHAAGRRVHVVSLEIGVLCAVVPEAMSFCFELAAEGTVAEGAKLEIRIAGGVAYCRGCGSEFDVHDPILLCRCGSADVELRSGRQLLIRSMEVSEACAQPVDAVTTRRP
ncbi:hydrogenase maturation nickel metallochaperone HypA/HybF [Nocardia pseudobrasiliensis]|uniref:Hydrogenase maturation factor HypA n=1 Tax=Nocardia pseudobrasiliensis TaxID=45979 RepID=A0A370HST5_9NOCA|nr:hydrogenase maturation nickel metallochaperone HypA [Nocardia pseudobrasiliensis]RDI61592.1 hydrogenase nickel incorporation protein HypA/HybF [Nocardia pseudobrasiliensis]